MVYSLEADALVFYAIKKGNNNLYQMSKFTKKHNHTLLGILRRLVKSGYLSTKRIKYLNKKLYFLNEKKVKEFVINNKETIEMWNYLASGVKP